jgi:hypothetical protein
VSEPTTTPPPVRGRLDSISMLVGATLLVIAFAAGWAFGRGGSDQRAAVADSTRPAATAPSSQPDSASQPDSDSEPAPQPASTEVTTPVPLAADLPDGTVPKAPVDEFDCPQASIEVTNANELTSALGNATAGDVIHLADGVYQGEFSTSVRATERAPIYLCGGRAAVLQGEGYKGDYVLHFDNATFWRVSGFTVRFGQKGVMVDAGTGIALQDLLVTDIGDEAVHLRNNSTDNVVRGLTIRNTGNRRDKFGEGVYIGTAVSNWPTITKGEPDNSDRNFVLNNVISETTSEAIDVKEGTSDGVVAGNTFDGSRLTGADSWVDIKGNGWLIAGNSGRTSPEDGFQTHVILPGWGDANLFTRNVADVNGGDGVGYYVHEQHKNKVSCSNKATGAGAGLTNFACTG